MREEHPNQQELPDLPPGGPAPAPAPGSEQVREMSEVAALQAQVLDLGLVKESRPVFVFDAKLAKSKKAGAERQAKYMEKQAAKGLIPAQVPRDLVELVKTTHGGDWSKLTQAPGIEVREVIKQVRVEVPVEVVKEVRVEVPVIKEVIKEVRVEVPGKPVLRLTAQQNKVFELGQRVSKLTGWRASMLRWLVS